ncbi:MAG: hypothetical protein ACI87A_001253, partial [Planctomycetota bacterium]
AVWLAPPVVLPRWILSWLRIDAVSTGYDQKRKASSE